MNNEFIKAKNMAEARASAMFLWLKIRLKYSEKREINTLFTAVYRKNSPAGFR